MLLQFDHKFLSPALQVVITSYVDVTTFKWIATLSEVCSENQHTALPGYCLIFNLKVGHIPMSGCDVASAYDQCAILQFFYDQVPNRLTP